MAQPSRDLHRIMAPNGERPRLIQTDWGSAAGTADAPYRPGWCSCCDLF